MNHEKTLFKNLTNDGPDQAMEQHTRITPPSKWPKLHLGELWAYRDLLWILAWRDIKVRYKQTMLGAAWAILQPLLTMVVFSLIFGDVAQLSTEGIPFPILTYTV